jgi:chromosomal replication initiation ATPase DnaA
MSPYPPTAKAIFEACATDAGLHFHELLDPEPRSPEKTEARHRAMWLLRQERTEIGRRRFGVVLIGDWFGVSHTTVSQAVRRYGVARIRGEHP